MTTLIIFGVFGICFMLLGAYLIILGNKLKDTSNVKIFPNIVKRKSTFDEDEEKKRIRDGLQNMLNYSNRHK